MPRRPKAREELENLDVIEAGSGVGRGAMQNTGVRRTAYAAARLQVIADGIDPNSNGWEAQYSAQEYAGLRDLPECLLSAWTRVFEDRPGGMDPAPAAEGYSRPTTPHTERRQAVTQLIWGLITREEQRWTQAN